MLPQEKPNERLNQKGNYLRIALAPGSTICAGSGLLIITLSMWGKEIQLSFLIKRPFNGQSSELDISTSSRYFISTNCFLIKGDITVFEARSILQTFAGKAMLATGVKRSDPWLEITVPAKAPSVNAVSLAKLGFCQYSIFCFGWGAGRSYTSKSAVLLV